MSPAALAAWQREFDRLLGEHFTLPEETMDARPWLKVPPPLALPLGPKLAKLPPLDPNSPRPDPRDQRAEAKRPSGAPHPNDA